LRLNPRLNKENRLYRLAAQKRLVNPALCEIRAKYPSRNMRNTVSILPSTHFRFSLTCLLLLFSAIPTWSDCRIPSADTNDTVTENGRIIGFKVSSRFARDSAQFFGFKSSDIILKINDFDLKDSKNTLQVWHALQETDRPISVHFRRHGYTFEAKATIDGEHLRKYLKCKCSVCTPMPGFSRSRLLKGYAIRKIRD
jgi:hypothetical protein